VRIFSHHVHLPIVVLASIETVAFLLVPYLAVYLRTLEPPAAYELVNGPLWPPALVMTGAVQICMVATGLYTTRLRATFAGILVRIVASVAAAITAVALLIFIFPDLYLGRGIMGWSALLFVLSAALIRLVFSRFVDENAFKRRVIVFGCGRQAMSISQLRRRSDQRGFLILGYIAPAGDPILVARERLLHSRVSLLELARELHVDEIVVAMDDRRREFPVQELLDCRLNGVDIVDIVTFLERETGKVRLDVLNPSWMIFSDGFRRDVLRLSSERAFDVIASSALLLITWPLILLAGLAIKLEDGFMAPVFYRQKRVGYEGKLFQVIKFRSMRPDAERDGHARWAAQGDARITKVGGFIRKYRLDELPQLLNVLKGDMSFVGPRPERPEFVAELNERIPYYRERHSVKPGITGWAQLCYPYGSSEHDATEKLQYDLYYVKNHSLLFDLMILLQTAEVVLWGKGGR
jgi:sugar transferase (PEP-CTERM system associated)